MEDENAILQSMQETVALLLKESCAANKNDKCCILLQTDSFFRAIITTININSSETPSILSLIHSFFEISRTNIRLFFENIKTASKLYQMLLFFSQCSLTNLIALDISLMMIELIKCDDFKGQYIQNFSPFIQHFFASSLFSTSFENSDGLYYLWNIINDLSKEQLYQIIFPELNQTIHLYFHHNDVNKKIEFLSTVIQTTQNIPEQHIFVAFQFIIDLITNSNDDLITFYIQKGGFSSINQYILSYNDSNFIKLYQFFFHSCSSQQIQSDYIDKTNPIISYNIDLLKLSSSQNIKTEALVQIYRFIKLFHKQLCPMTSESLYFICQFIEDSDFESINILIEIIHYLVLNFQYDLTFALPKILNFCSYSFFINTNASQLLDSFLSIELSFQPFASIFINKLTDNLSSEELDILIQKYPQFLFLIERYYKECKNSFLKVLFSLFSSYKDDELYLKVIMKCLLDNEIFDQLMCFLQFQNKDFVNQFLISISDMFLHSARLRYHAKRNNILAKIPSKEIPNKTIKDFIQSLSGFSFDVNFDSVVLNYMKTNSFFEMTKQEIRELAFITNNKTNRSHLIFPSLLPFCELKDIQITSPYDKWICGQYAIENWIKEANQSITYFPSIEPIINRYILPKHVPFILDNSTLLKKCYSTQCDMLPLFEFVAGFPDSQISFVLSEECHSLSFWLMISEYPNHELRIVSFSNFVLDLVNDTILLNHIQICNIEKNNWNHIILTITEKRNVCFLYINGQEAGSVNKIDNDNISLRFGSLLPNPVDWFIGGSIRVYSRILPNEAIIQLYQKGVSYLTRNTQQNESLIANANSFIDLFEGFKKNISEQFILSENSRPVISFPFLKHIANSYNRGKDLINIVRNKIISDNSSVESIREIIVFLCRIYPDDSKKSLAIQLSSFYYLNPLIFNENLLTNIFNYYTDLDSILPFLFDVSLFTPKLRSILISKLYGIASQFKSHNDLIGHLLNFVFHLVLYLDNELDDDEFLILVELIFKCHPNQHDLVLMIMISVDYLTNFEIPSLSYNAQQNQGRLYPFLRDRLISSIDETFADFHIIFIMNPNDSIQLLKRLLSVRPLKSLPLQLMINFCLQNTELIETWPVLLTLILPSKTKKPIQNIDSIEEILSNVKLDEESFPTFLLVLSFLAVHTLKENCKFSSLWNLMIQYTFSYFHLITPDLLASKEMITSLLNLSSLGFYYYQISLSSDLSIDGIDKAFEYSNWPETCNNESTKTKKLMKYISLMDFSLNKIYEHPMASKSSISLKTSYDDAFCDEILEANKKFIFKNWFSFMPKNDFPVSLVFQSAVFKDVLNILLQIAENFKRFSQKLNRIDGLNFLSDLELSFQENKKCNVNSAFSAEFELEWPISFCTHMNFYSYFVFIFSFVERLNPKYSKHFVEKFVLGILEICKAQHISCPLLLSFISRRLLSEKIESNLVIPILDSIFSNPQIQKTELPKEILELLLFGFHFVPDEQFSSFLSLFIAYPQAIFTSSNFECSWFILLLFEELYNLRNNFQLRDRSKVFTIMKIFSEILAQTIKKKDDSTIKRTVLNELDESIKNSESTISFETRQLLTEEREKYTNNFDTRLLISLKIDEICHNYISSILNDVINPILFRVNFFTIFSKSIGSAIRFHDRRIQLFELNQFLKLRETSMSELPITFSSKTKTVSLLNDPINPTRRFEMSPMIYSIPQSSKNVTSLLPQSSPLCDDVLSAVWPSYFYGLLSLDFKSMRILLHHSSNPLLLSFSYHVEIDDKLLLVTILNIITNFKSNEILFLTNASILYGVTPLNGVMIVDKQNLYFIEGLVTFNGGCSFQMNLNHEINSIIYQFYISYMNAGYFGPCYHFNGHPYLKLPMSQLIAFTSHLWLQMETAYELHFLLGWNFILILEDADSYSLMKKFFNDLVELNLNSSPLYSKYPSALNSAKLLKTPIREVVKLWSENIITTSTYLLFLNKYSGRSYADLTQFMIFPWIISDYSTEIYESIPVESFRNLALPMGQIGPDRIPRFDLFYETSKYYYGTHYMHLGVVLFYLFRADPYCIFSIYFHHGWDDPNRLFTDFTDAFLSAAFVSQNDVKEIIPQMFICPEYLENISNIDFALAESDDQLRKKIGQVRIASWSKNSRDFTRIMLREMESVRVSRSIHQWIDLIFGFKSRGNDAIEAKNIFHPLSYPNLRQTNLMNNDQIPVHDDVERNATKASIINFGQCPLQIFKAPHPVRDKSEHCSHLMSNPDRVFYQKLNCNTFAKYVWPVNHILIDSDHIYVAPENSLILNSMITLSFIYDHSAICTYSNNVYNDVISNISQNVIMSVFRHPDLGNILDEESGHPLPSNRRLSLIGKPNSASPKIQYNVPARPASSLKPFISLKEFASNTNSTDHVNKYHQIFKVRQTVNRIFKSSDNSLLALFFKEGGFTVALLLFEKYEVKSLRPICHFEPTYKTIIESIIDCQISTIHFLLVSAVCEHDTNIRGWKINRYDLGLNRLIDSIDINFRITKIAIDDHAALIIVCGERQIAVYSISGELLIELTIEQDSQISSVAVANLEEFVDKRYIMTGHSDGTVRFWNINFTLNEIVNLKMFKVCDSEIDAIAISCESDNGSASRAVAFSSMKKESFVFDFIGSNALPLDINYAIQCGICKKDFGELNDDPKICSLCSRFICSLCSTKNNEKKGIIRHVQSSKSQYLCHECHKVILP